MNDIILIALHEEAPNLIGHPNVFVTGVGKVNAGITAARLLERLRPDRVFNFGTAGGITIHSGIHKCTRFVQRDLDVANYTTNRVITHRHAHTSGGLTLSTGDNFVTDPSTIRADLVDMEGYAIAAAVEYYPNTEFHCYKYVSDSADENAMESILQNIHKGEPFYIDILREHGIEI